MKKTEVGASADATEAKRQLTALLNCRLRFELSDGRKVVGCFQCADSSSNVILSEAVETRSVAVDYGDDEPVVEQRQRNLNLAIVPGKHIVRVEAIAGDLRRAQQERTDDELSC